MQKVDVPCPVCGSEVYVRKTKRGKKYYICSNNTKTAEKSCPYISWDKPKIGEKWEPEETTKKSKTLKKTKTNKTTKTTKTTKTDNNSKTKK